MLPRERGGGSELEKNSGACGGSPSHLLGGGGGGGVADLARVPRNLCGGGGKGNGGTDGRRMLSIFSASSPPYNAHILPPPPSLLPLRTAWKEEESEPGGEKGGIRHLGKHSTASKHFPPPIYLCISGLKVCFHIMQTGGTALPAPLFHLMFLPMGQGNRRRAVN